MASHSSLAMRTSDVFFLGPDVTTGSLVLAYSRMVLFIPDSQWFDSYTPSTMETCCAKQPSPSTQSHAEGRSLGELSEPGGSTSYLVSHFPWGESPQNAWLLKLTLPLKHRTAESHQNQTGYPRGDKTRLDMNKGSGCSFVSGTIGGLGDKR